MILPFTDSNTGSSIYINPVYVVTLRPDPVDPDHLSMVKVRDGESIRIRGGHREVAERLARLP